MLLSLLRVLLVAVILIVCLSQALAVGLVLAELGFLGRCQDGGCQLVATIYVMPLGGHGLDEVIAALDRNKKFLRGEVAHRVNLKFAPDLRFRVDERFDEAERIEKLLRTPAVQKDLKTDSDQD